MTNKEIQNAYVGDTQVEKIYLGADVVYSANTIPLYPFILDSDNNMYSGISLSAQGVYDFNYQIPHGAAWTLYFNGQVVTASNVVLELHIDCNGDWYDTGEGIDETNYPIRDIDLGAYKASDEEYVGVAFKLNTNDMSIFDGGVTVYYCEPDPCAELEEGTQEKCECEGRYWWGDECHDEPEDPCAEYEEGTQERCECEGRYWWDDECHDEEQPTGHTVYADLNGTESVELLETVAGQMYEMVIAEPIYTSLTLYDNDQVVTADELVYVIDGIEYREENVEILDISADNYAPGAVITGISYDVLNNSVYLVFQM